MIETPVPASRAKARPGTHREDYVSGKQKSAGTIKIAHVTAVDSRSAICS